MSKNYINALLKPFRESKVVESLLKLFESGPNKPSGGVGSVKDEVNSFFCALVLRCSMRLYVRFLVVLLRCRRGERELLSTAQECGR